MALVIDPSCKIHPTAKINVRNGYIGKNAIINEYAVIEGYRVEIGREAFIDRFATIGGGSCFDSAAYLSAGDWFHMGVNSQVNTARGVTIGNEVGVGIDSKIFTHGAYLDCINLGAPVQWGGVSIGNNVWLPNAWVNPGVTIGSNVVIGARSLVTSNIPDGALAAGSPAKVLKENAYGIESSKEQIEKLASTLINQFKNRLEDLQLEAELNLKKTSMILTVRTNNRLTTFDLRRKTIEGDATKESEIIKDQLRRNGIRFMYEEHNSQWRKWT